MPGPDQPFTGAERATEPPEGVAAASAPPGAARAGLSEQFVHAVSEELQDAPLSPDALVRAVVRLLPVEAAGVTSMVNDLRLPLGSTSEAARTAETLQTSLGDGPCLAAARAGSALVSGLDEIRRRWPVYAGELERSTPFRSVAAIPLGSPGPVIGALDLYATDVDLHRRFSLAQVSREIGEPLAALLRLCLTEVSPDDASPRSAGPAWYARNAAQRHQVWIAVGMLLADEAVPITSSTNAIDLLRSVAYAREVSLDELAGALVEGRTSVGDVLGGVARGADTAHDGADEGPGDGARDA